MCKYIDNLFNKTIILIAFYKKYTYIVRRKAVQKHDQICTLDKLQKVNYEYMLNYLTLFENARFFFLI